VSNCRQVIRERLDENFGGIDRIIQKKPDLYGFFEKKD